MRQNITKRLLSYLTDIPIEHVQSDYNQDLFVVLKNDRYQLCTENAIYSYGDKYENFRQCFGKISLPKSDDTDVLLLGFGMGSIPVILEKIFDKRYSYTGVEIDPKIIYLATKYVLSELKSEVSVIEADARVFIDANTTKYDMICIDIFVDDKIPDWFLTEEFLLKIRNAIVKNGVILFNHLGYTHEDVNTAKMYFSTVFLKVFPDGVMVNVHKNLMMVNRKDVVFSDF